jgi:hypothetical protein
MCYLTSTEEIQVLGKGNILQVGTFGLGIVKIQNFNRCFWSKLEETIHEGERHAQNVRLNCCLNSATPVNSFVSVANITWLWVSDCCTRYLHCDQPFICSRTGDFLKFGYLFVISSFPWSLNIETRLVMRLCPSVTRLSVGIDSRRIRKLWLTASTNTSMYNSGC